ncbi:MAG: hypothetical protein KF773_25860 [Deltaproteobacteria bacterium]|nr:hypothetical protein [Deltaproteobacteria bacterium]MCW5803543.1 hypothetical protein [Deltaproteobacteria bacterium]
MNIISDAALHWFVTTLTAGLAGTWVVYDTFNLYRTRNADRSDPIVRDKHFGYVMGIIIGVVGILGCLRAHGVM